MKYSETLHEKIIDIKIYEDSQYKTTRRKSIDVLSADFDKKIMDYVDIINSDLKKLHARHVIYATNPKGITYYFYVTFFAFLDTEGKLYPGLQMSALPLIRDMRQFLVSKGIKNVYLDMEDVSSAKHKKCDEEEEIFKLKYTDIGYTRVNIEGYNLRSTNVSNYLNEEKTLLTNDEIVNRVHDFYNAMRNYQKPNCTINIYPIYSSIKYEYILQRTDKKETIIDELTKICKAVNCYKLNTTM